MPEFAYQDPFPLAPDSTSYRKLDADLVSTATFEGEEILKIKPEALRLLAREALRDVSFLYRAAHLAKVAGILDDPEASPNDRGVALALLRNAAVAAGFELPMCQDTGTATIIGKKGQRVWTGGAKDEEWLSRGVFDTYQKENLRYSQTIPLSMYDEINSGTNLPAQIDIFATPGEKYEFLFVAKGGGSANKSMLFQETKALLNPAGLEKFLKEKLRSLGTAACPPYHLAVVIGGTSAEATMKTVKLASAGYLDKLPTQGSKLGQAFRDLELEETVMDLARKSGIGAQFGGKYFAPRRPGDPPAPPWRQLPGGNRRVLLGRSQHQGPDRPRRDLARGAGARPGPVHPGAVPLGPGPQARRRYRPRPADEPDSRRPFEVYDLHPFEADRDDRGRA